MTWRELVKPVYVLTFLRSFLLGALPAVGLGHAVSGNGSAVAELIRMPSPFTLLAATALGILTGLSAIQNLLTPPPPQGGQS